MDEEKYTERVVGLVTPTEKAVLLQEAKDAGASMSTLVRQILMERRAHMVALTEAGERLKGQSCKTCGVDDCGKEATWCSDWKEPPSGSPRALILAQAHQERTQ